MICLPRLSAVAAGALALVAVSVVPARAQYGRPMVSDPPIGEKYHVEGVISFWTADLEALVSSESLGIPGTPVDVKADLGYTDKTIREFRVVLRPGRKHKFRVGYTPIKYEGDVLLQRTIIFNGISYTVGLPIQTNFTWNTWRFGYEYDFVYTDRGFVGFIVEARYVDAQLELRSPIDQEFTRAKGPVPAFGGIGRVYVHKHVSITGELTGMKLPDVDRYAGTFFDLDIYGTANVTNNFGVQVGYRTLDASYTAKTDTGDLKLRGLYFTGVARF